MNLGKEIYNGYGVSKKEKKMMQRQLGIIAMIVKVSEGLMFVNALL